MAARALLATTAVLVLAWVGVLLRDFEIGTAASLRAFYGPKPSRLQPQRDLKRLKDAELLNPDSYWKLSRANYYLRIGRPRSAARVAETVVREEPDNITAWGVLGQATKRTDRRRSARAAAEIRRLNPLSFR